VKKYFDQLRPMERRLAVGVIVVLLLVANYVVIWPHFGEWGDLDGKINQAQQKVKNYNAAIAQTPLFEQKLKKFQTEGEFVAPADQGVEFMRTIQSRAINTGVSIVSVPPSIMHTNDAFYVERVENISVKATDEQLVNFLYQLGNDPAMIRVWDLELHPDAPRQRLDAGVGLVASYQKTPGKNLKNATASAQ
jgi:type II secretory pathway component PulM